MSTEIAYRLSALAKSINAEHKAAYAAFKQGFEHALRAGELLLEAKTVLPHGQWLPWLNENCTFSERTAQLYMRIARERPRLECKSASLADLTLTVAVEHLSRPKDAKQATAPEPLPDSNFLLVTSPDGQRFLVPLNKKTAKWLGQNAVPAEEQTLRKNIAAHINELARQFVADTNELIRNIEETKADFIREGHASDFDAWLRHVLPGAFTDDNPMGCLLDCPVDADSLLTCLEAFNAEMAGAAP